jgi:hypothetical protein
MINYLVVSKIITTFVMTVMISKSGSTNNVGVAEGRLHPAFIYNKRSPIFCGDLVVYVKCYYYLCDKPLNNLLMCLSPIFYYSSIILLTMMVFFLVTFTMSMLVVKKFPMCKLSLWLRRNVITDEDLETKE